MTTIEPHAGASHDREAGATSGLACLNPGLTPVLQQGGVFL
jgi:hypothetical protein